VTRLTMGSGFSVYSAAHLKAERPLSAALKPRRGGLFIASRALLPFPFVFRRRGGNHPQSPHLARAAENKKKRKLSLRPSITGHPYGVIGRDRTSPFDSECLPEYGTRSCSSNPHRARDPVVFCPHRLSSSSICLRLLTIPIVLLGPPPLRQAALTRPGKRGPM